MLGMAARSESLTVPCALAGAAAKSESETKARARVRRGGMRLRLHDRLASRERGHSPAEGERGKPGTGGTGEPGTGNGEPGNRGTGEPGNRGTGKGAETPSWEPAGGKLDSENRGAARRRERKVAVVTTGDHAWQMRHMNR